MVGLVEDLGSLETRQRSSSSLLLSSSGAAKTGPVDDGGHYEGFCSRKEVSREGKRYCRRGEEQTLCERGKERKEEKEEKEEMKNAAK